MNWYEKIQAEMNKPDNSRELKRGEIKNIILDLFSNELSDFAYDSYKNGVYYFSRTRNLHGLNLLETLHVGYSLKNRNFYCSVSSCLNTRYQFESSYNIGPLNPHIDLIVLVKNQGAIKIEEAYYFHNGKLDTTRNVVEQIVKDYKHYGLDYLSNRFSRAEEDNYLKFGLRFIKELSVDPICLKTELQEELKNKNYRVGLIEHPIYIELKKQLQGVKGGTKEYRQYIPKLTYELLELYWDMN